MTAPSVPAGDVAKLVERARHAARVERTLSGTNAGSLHDEMATALEALSRDLAEARAALEPFAAYGDYLNREWPDHTDNVIVAGPLDSNMAFGDFRRARSVLSTQPKETPDG